MITHVVWRTSSSSSYYCAKEMSLILQNVIAFLPYAYRTSYRKGTYGHTLDNGHTLRMKAT